MTPWKDEKQDEVPAVAGFMYEKTTRTSSIEIVGDSRVIPIEKR